MSKAPYAYSVIAYAHDPVAGERLNCALLVWSPAKRVLLCLSGEDTRRLERAFGMFDRKQHARFLSDLKLRTEEFKASLGDAAGLWGEPGRLDEIARRLIRDPGLSYQASPARYGLAENVEAEAQSLFARFLGLPRLDADAPAVAPRRHRGDARVWQSFEKIARQREALRDSLHRVTIRSGGMQLSFEHAAKNGKYHVVQPVSFDFASAEEVADKAARCVGLSIAVEQSPEVAQLLLFVGEPADDALQDDFRSALEFMEGRIARVGRVFREEQAEALADALEQALAHP